MNSDQLKNKLRENIVLHEKLRENFHEEGGCIKNDSPEGIADRMNAGERLRIKIAASNIELAELFEQYSHVTAMSGRQIDNEVRTLFKQLREIIFATVGTVNNTVRDVKEARSEVVVKLRKMNRNKVAINAYARTG